MATIHTIPGVPTPVAAVSRILGRFDRQQIEGFIEVAISLLDTLDGDSDVEANGDERDGSGAEDDFRDHSAGPCPGPGCPISDPGEDDDEDRCSAGDDMVASGNLGCGALVYDGADRGIGDEDDAEPKWVPISMSPDDPTSH